MSKDEKQDFKSTLKASTLAKDMRAQVVDELLSAVEAVDSVAVLSAFKDFDCVNIYTLGASGAGKSTLTAAITGNPDIKIGHCKPTTMEPTPYVVGKGMKIWDTKGIETWTSEELTAFDKVLTPKNKADRPHVVVLCHNSAHRFLTENFDEKQSAVTARKNTTDAIQMVMKRNIPLVVALSNVYCVSAEAYEVVCAELKKSMADCVDAVENTGEKKDQSSLSFFL